MDAGLLIKGVSDTVKNEIKEQKGGFLGMFSLVCFPITLGAGLLGNMLAGKEQVKKK